MSEMWPPRYEFSSPLHRRRVATHSSGSERTPWEDCPHTHPRGTRHPHPDASRMTPHTNSWPYPGNSCPRKFDRRGAVSKEYFSPLNAPEGICRGSWSTEVVNAKVARGPCPTQFFRWGICSSHNQISSITVEVKPVNQNTFNTHVVKDGDTNDSLMMFQGSQVVTTYHRKIQSNQNNLPFFQT